MRPTSPLLIGDPASVTQDLVTHEELAGVHGSGGAMADAR